MFDTRQLKKKHLDSNFWDRLWNVRILNHILFLESKHLLVDDHRLDEKDTVDIHDNPPVPDNVVKEEDNTVRHGDTY